MDTIKINDKINNDDSPDKIRATRGFHLKWRQEGYWYKADRYGYESLAEVMVSRLLRCSNLTDYLDYEPVLIQTGGRRYRGSRSKDCTLGEAGEEMRYELVSLAKLSKNYTGMDLTVTLCRIRDEKERIRHTVELVEALTGIDAFREYLVGIVEMDAFFLNLQRSAEKLFLLYDRATGEYGLCPYLAMGKSFFSDYRDSSETRRDTPYLFGEDIQTVLKSVHELYGTRLKFDLTKIASEKNGFSFEVGKHTYKEKEIARIKAILGIQIRSYAHLF